MKKYICLLIVLSFSCANVIPPEGGPKDVSPPEIISTDPPNNSIYFNKNQIEIDFNEIITCNNSKIYSAPDYELIKKINISNGGKGIKLTLNENLRDSTTYVITIQNAISDINEGNTLESFKYTFSTGPSIDTATISGKTIEMNTNNLLTNCLVGIFEGDTKTSFDSIIRVKKPLFFCFSDNLGEFKFENLRPGLYTAFCIKDDNLNFKYEESEMVSMPVSFNLEKSKIIDFKLFLDDRFETISIKDTVRENNIAENDSISTENLNLGKVNLIFKKDIYKTNNYIGQFIKNDSIINNFNITDSIVSFDDLKKGTYQLKLIEDLNNNNYWDRGNIKELISPENVLFLKDSIEVRPKWELNFIVDI